MPSFSALSRWEVDSRPASAAGLASLGRRRPRAWRSRLRVDTAVTEIALLPDGSRSSLVAVSFGDASRFHAPGVYASPSPLPSYHAPLPLRSDGEIQLLSLVQSLNARQISGEICVRNRAYAKDVRVRVTHNGWRSFEDVTASYSHSFDEHRDVFAFQHLLPTPPARGRSRVGSHHVELAVVSESAGVAAWDNNHERNFRFTLVVERAKHARIDRGGRTRRQDRKPVVDNSAERDRRADEVAAQRQRSLAARFFASERRGGQVYDRSAPTAAGKLPVVVRYNADAFAPIWLDRRRRLGRDLVDLSIFGPPRDEPGSAINIGLLRAERRIRPHSPWRPLLITGPPSPPSASSSSSSSSSAGSSGASSASSSASSTPSTEVPLNDSTSAPAHESQSCACSYCRRRRVPTRPRTLIAVRSNLYAIFSSAQLSEPAERQEQRPRRLDRTVRLYLVARRSPRQMQLLVRGVNGKITTVTARGRCEILNFQHRLAAKVGIPVAKQRLTYAGQELHPRSRLADHGLRGGSTIHLSLRLVAGGLPSSFRPWLETNFRSAFTEVSDRIGALKALAHKSNAGGALIARARSLIRQL